MRFVILASVLLFSACGHDHDPAGYASYQLCFDEHTTGEGLTITQAVVVCCLDHPIGGATEVCGTTDAACVTYLTANLLPASASGTEIAAACTEYITQKGM